MGEDGGKDTRKYSELEYYILNIAMGFFSHAAMLGVGYWIGKSYCFRYKVHELKNEPNASEVVLRVERNEGFWPGHWHHHYCRYEKAMEKKKNPEVLEVETK